MILELEHRIAVLETRMNLREPVNLVEPNWGTIEERLNLLWSQATLLRAELDMMRAAQEGRI